MFGKTVPGQIAGNRSGKHFTHTGKPVRGKRVVMDIGTDHLFSSRCAAPYDMAGASRARASTTS